MLFDMPVRSVICVPNQVNEAIAKFYPKDAKQFIARDGANSNAMSAAEALEHAARDRKASRLSRKKEKEKAKAEKPAEPVGPLSEEAEKQRMNSAIVAFNLSVMACMGVTYLKTGMTTGASVALGAGTGILLGAVAAGVAYKFFSRR